MNALVTDITPHTSLDAQPRQPQGKVNGGELLAQVRNHIDARKQEQTDRIAPEDYKPEPIALSESNHNWFGGKAFQFQLKPIVQQYYGPNRFFGYAGSAVYGEFVDRIDKPKDLDSNAKEKSGGYWGVEAKNKTEQRYRHFGRDDEELLSRHKRTKGEQIALYTEAGLFTSLSVYYAYQDINKIVEDNRSSLAAEFGKHPTNVNYFDVLNSDNNIISTQANKWMWRTAAHTGSGMAYLVNLPAALLASAVNITVERFMLSNETAYEMTEKLINKVQLNHLAGDVTKETVISSLQEIMQQARVDHNFELISSKEFETIRPVLSNIAQDIMNKEANMSMVIEYLGAGNIIPGKLEQSQKNYEYAKQTLLEKAPEMLEKTTKSTHLRERAQFINGQIDYRGGGYPR